MLRSLFAITKIWDYLSYRDIAMKSKKLEEENIKI